MKNSLGDVERYYTAKARHAPHVIAHYTAGARVIGLTDRQMQRHLAKLEQDNNHTNSPYAKPLHFVTMIANKEKNRSNQKGEAASEFKSVKIGQKSSPPCRGRRMAIMHHDDEETASMLVCMRTGLIHGIQ